MRHLVAMIAFVIFSVFGISNLAQASTEPPVTEPPTTTVVVDPPPPTTDPAVVTYPGVCAADGIPRLESEDCRPDPCLFSNHSGYTSDYVTGTGDSNDLNGTTQWYIVPCHVSVPDAAPAHHTLPVTGSGSKMALTGLAALLFAAGVGLTLLASRRKAQQ